MNSKPSGATARGSGGPGVSLRDAVIAEFPSVPGSYVLRIRLKRRLRVATRADLLEPGWYAYAGSARGSGGLRARVGRHLLPRKASHWHIDRLTRAGVVRSAYLYDGASECDLFQKLLSSSGAFIPAPGFGSSDCARCASHLVGFGADCDLVAAALASLEPLYVYHRHDVR